MFRIVVRKSHLPDKALEITERGVINAPFGCVVPRD